ncbi:MAG: DUF1080 domain-containing protein [Akkermansiaceae bacterium]
MKLTALLILSLSITSLSAKEPAKETSIFDGKTLNGWKTVNPAFAKMWSVKDGIIVSGDGQTKIPANTYLATTKEYGDFEFRCLFRITGDHKTGLINSGIQYRSIIKGTKIIGYQADIGKDWWGGIYDEHRRGKLVKGDISTLQHVLNPEGWNSYIIRCKGNHHQLYINGVLTADYIEKDEKIATKGVIAVQIHSGGKAKVEFKGITVTDL